MLTKSVHFHLWFAAKAIYMQRMIKVKPHLCVEQLLYQISLSVGLHITHSSGLIWGPTNKLNLIQLAVPHTHVAFLFYYILCTYSEYNWHTNGGLNPRSKWRSVALLVWSLIRNVAISMYIIALLDSLLTAAEPLPWWHQPVHDRQVPQHHLQPLSPAEGEQVVKGFVELTIWLAELAGVFPQIVFGEFFRAGDAICQGDWVLVERQTTFAAPQPKSHMKRFVYILEQFFNPV